MSLNSLQDSMSRRAASMAAMAKRATNPEEIQAIQQSLVTGVQNGSIQPYIGIPLIQDLTKKLTEAKASMAQNVAGAGMPQPPAGGPPIAQQVMQQAAQANQPQGIEALPSNLPQEYAGGGIIAFEEGGQVERYQNKGLVSDDDQTKRNKEREAQARRDRAALLTLPAAAGDILAGPYNYLAQTGEAAANAIGVPRFGRALGIYDSDVNSVGIPRIGAGGNTPFSDMMNRYAAGDSTAPPPTPAANPYDPATATRRSQYTNAPAPRAAPTVRPDPGIDTLLGGADAGAGSMSFGKGQSNLLAPPTGKSTETFAREQFKNLGDRSEARIAELIAAQNANKMEGKPFDDLKKMLQEEAAQAGIEKSDAKNMAIFKAGLAIMGGTSRNALENISKGAIVGAEDYQKAAADLKKADKERQKQFAAIEEARRAEDRDDFKTRNARLETAYTARQRSDELGSAAISAGYNVDKAQATDIWKTQFSGAKTIEAALIGERSAKYTADVGASSRVQAAELRADMAGLGEGKGALTQNQLIEKRRELAESPQIAAFKRDLINQYGKNIVNQPGYQEALNQRIDQLLMQMSARPGAASGLDNNAVFKSFLNNNPGIQQYFK